MTLRARFLAAAFVVVAAAVAPCAWAATATVDPAGYIRVDGQPFFPIGMIHTSWIGDRQGAPAVPDLHAIADAGFNLIHPTVDFRPDMADLLAAAEARGVRVIAEIPWGGAAAAIDKWKASPAIIGWNIADDFNAPRFGPPNHPPSEVADRQSLVRAHAPNHLTYASGGPFPGFSIAPYVGTMDVMAFQSYPIDEQSYPYEDELQEAMDEFDYVAAQLAGTDQLFVANPQAFAWSNRYPTVREARNILYAPLIRGAKGVIWYTFWGENGVLAQKNPTLWTELARDVVELKSLAPFLLFGARTDFATGNARVHGAYWVHDEQVVTVLLNTHRTSTYSLSLALPPDVGAAHALFPARTEDGMTVSGGQLVGTIGPEEVHVYVLDMAPSGNTPPVAVVTVSPSVPALGTAVTLDASASYDPDGSVGSVEWDFGDGTFAGGAIVSHTFATLGTHHVRVTVRDAAGMPATAFVPVTVDVTTLCGTAPLTGCSAAPRAQLALKMPASTKQRRLTWKWGPGPVPASAVGDPSSADVALCAWDAGGKRIGTGILAHATGWKALGTAFRYSNRAGAPGGVIAAKLGTGDSSGRLQVKGKGTLLPDPALPFAPPLTVQLVDGATGACWTSTWSGAAITRNTSQDFKARN